MTVQNKEEYEVRVEQLRVGYEIAKQEYWEQKASNQRLDRKIQPFLMLISITFGFCGFLAKTLLDGHQFGTIIWLDWFFAVCFITYLIFLWEFYSFARTAVKIIQLKSFKHVELDSNFVANLNFLHKEDKLIDFYVYWINKIGEFVKLNKKSLDEKINDLEQNAKTQERMLNIQYIFILSSFVVLIFQ